VMEVSGGLALGEDLGVVVEVEEVVVAVRH
jgi:hypothetical protein